MYLQLIPIGGIRTFQLKKGKSCNEYWLFFISRPCLYAIQFCALIKVWLVIRIFVFLELENWDYPPAIFFPHVNYIFSGMRNVHKHNVIVFFQPLQGKQRLTWVGTCETKYCFYLSELAIMDQQRNVRTYWDLVPKWYFLRLGLIWANGKKLPYIYSYVFFPQPQLFYEGN